MFVYIYDWDFQFVSDKIVLRAFGLDESNRTISLIIKRFYPYVYLEVSGRGNHTTMEEVHEALVSGPLFSEHTIPVYWEIVHNKKLYYTQTDDTDFIRYFFKSNEHFRTLPSKLKKKIELPGGRKVKVDIHEYSISPILQFACMYDIPMCGWVEFEGKQIEGFTNCDEEYIVEASHIRKTNRIQHTPSPVVLSFDLEVYSSNPNKFPRAEHIEDCIFQVSCSFWRLGTNESVDYLITVGAIDSNIVQDDQQVVVMSCSSEEELLLKFIHIVHEHNPHIITGWNILGFDIDYLSTRCRLHSMEDEIASLGMIRNHVCDAVTDSWSSSAYGRQSFTYYKWNGRIIMDLLVFARREIKSENYKLDTIASMYVKTHKDPLTHIDIFNGYKWGVLEWDEYRERGTRQLSLVGKYCVKDSILVKRLFIEFDMWLGITEMSAVCNVPASFLYTKGQQIKVFSQVYKYCTDNHIVVEKDVYECKDNERYQGAYVKEPVPGLYDHVVPMDFASLYPSIIVAYNIDYNTLVIDESIPDEQCNIVEWTEDHEYDILTCPACSKTTRGERAVAHNKWLSDYNTTITCEHCYNPFRVDRHRLLNDPNVKKRTDKFRIPTTVLTDTYKYRFIKSPQGVLPSIIQNLLQARKNVRNTMKELKKGLKKGSDDRDIDENDRRTINLISILNKRQLSYKVSANSMYGALGVRVGMLPLMPGAMCVTAIGRQSLHRAATYLMDTYNVKWIYSDTDSTYIQFPNTPPERIWETAKRIEQEMVEHQIFPPPMKLEFEEAVYHPFFILTKKRYMWKNYNQDGTITDKIGNKGVVLARRGTSNFVKWIYQRVVEWIFESCTIDQICERIVETLNRCCSGSFPVSDFIITKEVNDLDSYMDDRLPPPHIMVAKRMIQRGKRVDSGQRLEYIITTRSDSPKVAHRAEDVAYQRMYSHILKIDYLYYVHLCMKQVDELLNVAYKLDTFMVRQYDLRVRKYNIQQEIIKYFRPSIRFE